MRPLLFLASFGLALSTSLNASEPISVDLKVRLNQPAKAISSNLFGIFYEDLNYAADGGLYAELVQNRSFEYSALEQPDWNALSFWEVSLEGDGQATLIVDGGRPIHQNNPKYGVFKVEDPGGKAAIRNRGFNGISIDKGESYNLSLFARQLYKGNRWSPDTLDEKPLGLLARLLNSEGETIAEAPLPESGNEWSKLETTLVAKKSAIAGQLEIIATEAGGIALDMISLFPNDTYQGHRNGLRKDLAQTIADTKPQFMRFPGGCLVHGNGIGNFYNWKHTIGPIEERRGQPNLWGYHQTGGLGYFEYFQFCEDMGAIPIPVVAAAVSCQNSGHTAGSGQSCIQLEELDLYIEDILDLIEWANGPADSTWGSKRAAAGHPEPFGLKFLGVGNEDKITPEFEERFTLIYDAIKNAHPEIVVIGTVGPSPDGTDYEEGWRISNKLDLEIVDEHYYQSPDWFWQNLERYDSYDRSKATVYLGEYAAHDQGRKLTLRAALAEAAYMTSLERNGDIVGMASYAPLLAKLGNTQWNPDLIYFDNQTVYPTISYEVQKLFGQSQGDEYIHSDYTGIHQRFTASTVRNSQTAQLYTKLVNGSENPIKLAIDFDTAAKFTTDATITTLTGNPLAENTFENPNSVQTHSKKASIIQNHLDINMPPYSLLVVTVNGRPAKNFSN
ncbi:alpha-L-arabinofuranosidase C-terminal domain-containing protein [Pelagicoccus sp. SDUM812002]|uniref:alpha-L-arabinofuranosidase C-terminal domain-containing protein n=1 Tax=Pelagicoccus sp. SDUM812002 TaxID=3041266 RepID=UPI00280F42E5|nr:alpha-L-arabinofuranosidase C-terminal domain-containing protein [Pelagicoccus sp. SDUM812002]MDQ8184190.1 alpha-L-arabinofuranosidase C-terminal domain-containing protein [Pelagicoccus sp. SDUM812002]